MRLSVMGEEGCGGTRRGGWGGGRGERGFWLLTHLVGMLGCTDTEPRVCITVLAEGGQDKASVAVVTCWFVQFFFAREERQQIFFFVFFFPIFI